MLNAEERRASSTDSTSTAHGAAAVHSGVSTSFPLQKALVGPLRQVSLDLLTAAALAHGLSVPDAVAFAKRWVTECLRAAYPLGQGHGPVSPLFRLGLGAS